MTEPTRPIRQPTVDQDGSLVAHTVATPKSFTIRARMTVGPRKVIPVIFVPGIMGTNLRVRRDVFLPEGLGLKPGEAAWRPPNGALDGFTEAWKWEKRNATQRQRILDAGILEVDDSGELDLSGCSLTKDEMRERGWGEVHLGSYGALLVELQSHLDMTFRANALGELEVREHWKRVMNCRPGRWGVRNIEPVTEAELKKYADFQYPVYAVGYNWLESCGVSAKRLDRRIDEIKKFWTSRKHACDKVILVTHSMGGLVARACARARAGAVDEPGDIAGIIHGVMPACGAPVAYRRIACGTEGGRFDNSLPDKIRADKFVQIAGESAADTTPVLAAAPGVLELLPTTMYPQPWLVVGTVSRVNNKDEFREILKLPRGNPYDLYRDMDSWFRMIDPTLADPAEKNKAMTGGTVGIIRKAIETAEKFHGEVLTVTRGSGDNKVSEPYYHPNTYAFYGVDENHRAFGRVTWVARLPVGQNLVLTPSNLEQAKYISHAADGSRTVEIEGRVRLQFRPWPEDVAGDDTIPQQSGAAPAGRIKQIFATGGYRHQDSYRDSEMVLLTRHLIVKIVQGIK
jgi:pimeloyl-ACP methyl ester carboxylesterase